MQSPFFLLSKKNILSLHNYLFSEKNYTIRKIMARNDDRKAAERLRANRLTSRGNKNKSKAKKGDEDLNMRNTAKFVTGLVMVFLGLFLLIAFVSYISSGKDDYNILESHMTAQTRVGNVCGSLGVRVAHFFLHDCFGLASFFLLAYLINYGMHIVLVKRFKSIRMFVLYGVIMIWSCVFFASPLVMNIPLCKSSHFNMGGLGGENTVDFLTSAIGLPGLYFVIVISAIFILIYFSIRTIDVVRSILRLKHIRSFVSASLNHMKQPVVETSIEGYNEDDDPIANGVVDLDTGRIINMDKKLETKDERRETRDEGRGTRDEGRETREEEAVQTAIEFDDVVAKSQATQPDAGVTFEVETAKNEERDENIAAEGKGQHFDLSTPYDPRRSHSNYKAPTMDLLDNRDDANPQIDMEEQTANKDRIIQVLHSFGVEISSIKATVGPTITLYEITLAEGVRINKVRNLGDDIALTLAAEGIRIIAPIPGKGTVGIEVPNKKKSIVSMESVLSSSAFQNTTMELPCALGKTITNEVYMIDLAKAPHLLVAGATGMGKSVGLNAIVASLLYKKHPDELKIVMVDPKKVEFSIYSPIANQFLAQLEEEEEPIITDTQRVVKTLNSLCQLMDERYALLKRAQVRSIKEYNEKFKSRVLNPLQGHAYMPYYVVIIDEFGDLIMTAGKEIELPICRIAQMARAVGIHMIIATQRPTASIITGTIKANFPARMAFKVSSMIDSRIILDRPGANQLVGKGDMLYLQGNDPVRVQCAFIDTPEVARICQHISTQPGFDRPTYLPEVVGEDGGVGGGADIGTLDPMFEECARLIVSKQQGSTSLLQRQFSIGYNRAGRLMDQMEKAGVVGPVNGAKPREVLVQDFNTLDRIINGLR